ncbi:keywimysin-related RiPP [Streptomyces sp. Ac-502]
MKKAYETPTLVRLGSFRQKTGLLARHGNDRLVLSKN